LIISVVLGCDGSGGAGVTREKLLGGGLDEDQKVSLGDEKTVLGK